MVTLVGWAPEGCLRCEAEGPVHAEGHAVSQAPAVAGGGVCTGTEQSQAAAVAIEVLVLLS